MSSPMIDALKNDLKTVQFHIERGLDMSGDARSELTSAMEGIADHLENLEAWVEQTAQDATRNTRKLNALESRVKELAERMPR